MAFDRKTRSQLMVEKSVKIFCEKVFFRHFRSLPRRESSTRQAAQETGGNFEEF